mgnify:CR=1 FL=1
MNNIEIKVVYENNKIYVKVDKKTTLLLSDDKKQINASEIYDCLNYEIGKKYILLELKDYTDINDDYKTYLKEIYEIFKTIIKAI